MAYFAEASANGSVKAYFKTRRSIIVTSSATATATSDISYEDAYKLALGIAQDVANSNAQNDANVMQVSVDTATIGETDFYLDSSLIKDFVRDDGNNSYTLIRDFNHSGGLSLKIDEHERFTIDKGVTHNVGKTSALNVLGKFINRGTFNCDGTFANSSNKSSYNIGSFTITSTSPNTNIGTIYNGFDDDTYGIISYNSYATFNIGENNVATNINYTNSGTFFNLAILNIAPTCTFTSSGTFHCAYNPSGTIYSNYYISNQGTCNFSGNIYLVGNIFNCATEINIQDNGSSYSSSAYNATQACKITFNNAVVLYNSSSPSFSTVTNMINYNVSNSIIVVSDNGSPVTQFADFIITNSDSPNNTGYTATDVAVPT